MDSSHSQHSGQNLYKALGTQFYETNRCDLPAELTERLVQLPFLAVEAARCSRRLRISGAPLRHAWQRLIEAGFSPYHRDALMRAGVQATLVEMPHLGGQSGDFIQDTQALIDELLELQRERRRQVDAARGAVPIADSEESAVDGPAPTPRHDWEAGWKSRVRPLRPSKGGRDAPRAEEALSRHEFQELNCHVSKLTPRSPTHKAQVERMFHDLNLRIVFPGYSPLAGVSGIGKTRWVRDFEALHRVLTQPEENKRNDADGESASQS